MTEADWLEVFANQLQVDGADFTSIWDFLSAIAMAPAFCDGSAGPSYARFADEAMCAKEFATMAAVAITQTGTEYNDLDTLLADDGTALPAMLQGMQVTGEPLCQADHANYDETNCAIMQSFLWSNYAEADTFYTAIVDADDTVANDLDYYPRGAGWTSGIEQYYWMSQVIYGDNTLLADPSLLETDPVTFWLSGLMTWMIPMNGKPAPHNIAMGQWEPTEEELEMGLSDGMGAISSLLYGAEQCGMSRHPTANARTSIYDDLMASFEAEDGSWTAAETIYSWEDSGCEAVAREAFPATGDYSAIPQFAIGEVNASTADSGCFVTTQTTEYIIWKKNAFRDCTIAAKFT